jgi:hypothetical protein
MDIRLRELELLAKIDRCGRLTVGPLNGPERDGGRDVTLQITHSGRVRMAELREFRSAKLREQYEILWDGRYFDTDLRIARSMLLSRLRLLWVT